MNFDAFTQLIMRHGKTLCFIPTTVIEPAMEIIRKYEIDKWEEYKNSLNGAMGGSRSVSYWDGEKMAGTSTDHMPGASGAYSSLYTLFGVDDMGIKKLKDKFPV